MKLDCMRFALLAGLFLLTHCKPLHQGKDNAGGTESIKVSYVDEGSALEGLYWSVDNTLYRANCVKGSNTCEKNQAKTVPLDEFITEFRKLYRSENLKQLMTEIDAQVRYVAAPELEKINPELAKRQATVQTRLTKSLGSLTKAFQTQVKENDAVAELIFLLADNKRHRAAPHSDNGEKPYLPLLQHAFGRVWVRKNIKALDDLVPVQFYWDLGILQFKLIKPLVGTAAAKALNTVVLINGQLTSVQDEKYTAFKGKTGCIVKFPETLKSSVFKPLPYPFYGLAFYKNSIPDLFSTGWAATELKAIVCGTFSGQPGGELISEGQDGSEATDFHLSALKQALGSYGGEYKFVLP